MLKRICTTVGAIVIGGKHHYYGTCYDRIVGG